jgi:hypothetical protein
MTLHRLSPTARPGQHGRLACQGDSCPPRPIARREREWVHHHLDLRSEGGGVSALRGGSNDHTERGKNSSACTTRRTFDLSAYDPYHGGAAVRGRLSYARSLSIKDATSSISCRSASSASRAATSAAICWRRPSLSADSTSALRIASERFIPEASRRERARSASSSRRTEIALVMSRDVYQD